MKPEHAPEELRSSRRSNGRNGFGLAWLAVAGATGPVFSARAPLVAAAAAAAAAAHRDIDQDHESLGERPPTCTRLISLLNN
jgi:hypothetical protein